jgi:predicted dehydrogenase
MNQTPSRRQFLKGAALGAAPLILPSRIWGVDNAPSSKITMGFIGCGKQMGGLLGGFLGQKGVVAVAVCDVDTTRREAAKQRIVEHYSKTKPEGWTGAESYSNFEELLARKDIDAVCIATPDHWHAFITVAALKAGKDVYCEKPLTHNIHEALTVIDTVKATNRVLQTGSMQRSMQEFRVAAELVQNGVIGKISKVSVQFNGPPRPNDLPEEAMEPGLDWKRWLGPAPEAKYNSILAPRGIHNHFPNWREYSEYGGGYVTDWGAHHIDIAQWGLGMDGNGPVSIKPPAGCKEAFASKHNLKLRHCEMTYANGIVLNHADGGDPDGYGVYFYGSDGIVKVNRGKFEVVLKGEVFAKKSDAEDKVSVESQYMKAERELLKDAKIKLYKSSNHLADFLDCVRERKKPNTNEIVGGGSAIACHLMNIAYRTETEFKWDPVKNVLVGDAINAKELTRDYQGPWKV